VTVAEHGGLARVLPLKDGSRKFVSRIDGEATVSVILDRAGLVLSEVSRDIVSLVRMGLISFLREEAAPTPPSRVEAAGIKEGVQALNRDAIRQAHEASGAEQMFSRLEREFSTIRHAAPPVVLGIPADSERPMVDKAAARMRQRYAEIVAKRDVSDDIRHLALEIAKRVDQAHRNFNFDQQVSTGSRKANTTYVDEVDALLNQGKTFIAKKAWSEADDVLAKAHQKRIDNVPVLANLGWARIHNPDLDLSVRTEEGKDFLLLAEQFDPTDGDGQYYLAQLLVASNRLDAAEERAARAVKALPEDKVRQALLRKI